MKKSVRPAASKVSGDRGKAEATSTTVTGKPATKSSTVVPLSKVRIMMMMIHFLFEFMFFVHKN